MISQRALRKLSAILTVGLAALFAYFAVYQPLSSWRATAMANLASAQTEKAQLIASIERLRAEKQSFVSDDLAGLTWEAAQIAEATAKVQSAVNDMGRSTGILMRSIAPVNATGSGIPNAISFRLEFEARLDQLVPFLRDIEFGRPALVITRANLRRLARPNERGAQPDLFVQINVAAPITLDTGTEG